MTLFAPLFLLGLLGIALPVWLHRMNYSNPETRPFTATFLLRHTELTAATEHRLRYLLLLAARLLALVFLVLLFTQPAWQSTATTPVGEDNRIHYLVVDTSLSMRAGDRFARARAHAGEELDRIPAGQSVQLFSMGENLAALSSVTTDISEVRRLLNQLEPGVGSMDYGVAMQQLDNLMRTSEASRDLVVISDLQRSNLPNRFSQLVPASASTFRLVPIAEGEANERLNASWNEGLLEVNFSSTPPDEETSLEVWLNGDLVQSTAVPANSTRMELDLSSVQLLPGGNTFEIRWLVEDGLSEDNRTFLAVDRSVRLRVLLLANSADLSDALFAETAFESIAGEGLDLDTRHAGDTGSYDPTNYDLVVSVDLGALPAALLDSLETYTRNGGQLLAALGQQTLGMNQVPLGGQPVNDAPLGNTSGARQFLVPSADTHPLLDDLNLGRTVNVFRWVTITPSAQDNVLVQLTSGDPWAIEHPIGNGRLLLFTTPLDNSWSDLPLSPSFVPLLENAVQWLSANFVAPEGLYTGDSLLVGQSTDADLASPIEQVIAPSGEAMLGLGQLNQASPVTFTQAGVYELQTANSSRFIAVNVPPVESDLAPMASDQISRWLELANADDDADRIVAAGAGSAPQWQSFEKWLLPLVLLFILVETLMANAHLRVRRQVIS